jgi:hypothetical protein
MAIASSAIATLSMKATIAEVARHVLPLALESKNQQNSVIDAERPNLRG